MYLRLRSPERVFREQSGATRFRLPGGEALRLAPIYRSVLDDLLCGISECAWERLEADPRLSGLTLALTEHRLLETAERQRPRTTTFQSKVVAEAGSGAPLLFSFVLLAGAGAAFFALRVAAEPTQQPLPAWCWFLAPIVYTFIVVLHECGHAAAAYSCGQRPRIQLWLAGAFRPRCMLTQRGVPLSSLQRNFFLAAGPATDAVVLSVAAAGMRLHGAEYWPAVVALCGSLAVIANLRPSGASDMNQLLRQVAAPTMRRGVRAVVAVTLAIFLVLTLETLVRLVVGG